MTLSFLNSLQLFFSLKEHVAQMFAGLHSGCAEWEQQIYVVVGAQLGGNNGRECVHTSLAVRL